MKKILFFMFITMLNLTFINILPSEADTTKLNTAQLIELFNNAINNNDSATVRKMLTDQDDPNCYKGYTQHNLITHLHIAAKHNMLEIATILLQHPRINVNAQMTTGETALHFAVFWGQEKMVELLLAHNANPLLRNKNNESALDLLTLDPSRKDHFASKLRTDPELRARLNALLIKYPLKYQCRAWLSQAQ